MSKILRNIYLLLFYSSLVVSIPIQTATIPSRNLNPYRKNQIDFAHIALLSALVAEPALPDAPIFLTKQIIAIPV
ncbi:MAG: hypothetical protein JXA52_06410 [Planctomycetes bacterium]|nr:hypothetical protein [Planctomycetota bacterium]